MLQRSLSLSAQMRETARLFICQTKTLPGTTRPQWTTYRTFVCGGVKVSKRVNMPLTFCA